MTDETLAPEQARARKTRIVGAVLVNLIPVLGVLFGGWSAFALMLLYWLENVVIGVFNIARMIASGIAKGPAGIAACLFIVPFFIFHYGIFCLVHGVFVMALFGEGLQHLASGAINPRDLSSLLAIVTAATPGLRAGFISILIWQSVLFVVFFLGGGQVRRTDPMTQMAAPYARIIILHFTIMAGGFAVMALGQPLFGVLILALLKTAFDIGGETWQGKQARQSNEAWNKAMSELSTLVKIRGKTKAPPR